MLCTIALPDEGKELNPCARRRYKLKSWIMNFYYADIVVHRAERKAIEEAGCTSLQLQKSLMKHQDNVKLQQMIQQLQVCLILAVFLPTFVLIIAFVVEFSLTICG
jgi:hypothetical protein